MEIRGLEGLAQVSTDFVTAVLILAGLSAALILALYELGLRHMVNRWLVTKWLRKKTGEGGPVSFDQVEDELMRLAGTGPTLYALRHQQLSGLVGSAVQSALDNRIESALLDVFAAPAGDDLKEVRARGSSDQRGNQQAEQQADPFEVVAHQLERGVDELQTYLAKFWGTLDYTLAFVFSLSLVTLLVFLPSDFRPEGASLLFFSVGLASGLLAPLVRRLLERILSLG